MYIATLLTDIKNTDLRRRIVNVEFVDGEATLNKEFQFQIDVTVEVIKRTIKQYLDELNFVPPEITGDLTDVPEVPPPAGPTQAELDKAEWEEDWNRLQRVDQLIAAQILTGNEAAVVTLRNKVKTNFKASYL